MKARIKSEVLKEIVNVAGTLVDEARFVIGKNGLETQVVDSSRVSMAELTLSKEGFVKLDGDGEFGIDLGKLGELVKASDASDIIEMNIEKNKLSVKSGTLTYKIGLVDQSAIEKPKVPEMALSCKVSLSLGQIKNCLKLGESVSEFVTLEADEKGFGLHAEGDIDDMLLYLPKDILTSIECPKPVKSRYPLAFFGTMIKSIGAENITIQMGTNYPLRIEWELAGGLGKAAYVLAPCVEDGE